MSWELRDAVPGVTCMQPWPGSGVWCSGSSRCCASTAGAQGGDRVLPRRDLVLPLLRGAETGDGGVSSLPPENPSWAPSPDSVLNAAAVSGRSWQGRCRGNIPEPLSPMMETAQPGDKVVGVCVQVHIPLPGSCWGASACPGVTPCASARDSKTLGNPEGPKAHCPVHSGSALDGTLCRSQVAVQICVISAQWSLLCME